MKQPVDPTTAPGSKLPKIGEGADRVMVEFDDKLRRMFEQVYARSTSQAIILSNDLPLSVAKPLVRAILKKPS